MQKTVLSVDKLDKCFKKEHGQEFLVLQQVNFELREGEIVALLGKSGSGKSTLLRIIAGLSAPTHGEIRYYNDVVRAPVEGIAMVFQNFALLPWLTVLQNVELGLEALGLSRDERRTRSLKAIDTVGLDGFESAFPKELSGGMRQRVGFARALVVNPTLLLMDEPFSALDVLTAENLKTDLLDLWQAGQTNTKSILFVTHNIEEAVKLADRILIFSADPGSIQTELKVGLAHPRNEQSLQFRQLVDKIYTIMTSAEAQGRERTTTATGTIDLWYRLPDCSISELLGMLETLNSEEHGGKMDLPELAETLHLDVDDMLPITEILEILELAKVREGDIELTSEGTIAADATILENKKAFAKRIMDHIPIIRYIRQVLDSAPHHRAHESEFIDMLESSLSDMEAMRILKVAIDWGRYAEIFAYDATSGTLNLENPE